MERTFGWLVKCRRLVRYYEAKVAHSEARLLIPTIALMLRRVA
jgi:transposase